MEFYLEQTFKPDYRYTSNFVDMWSVDEIVMVDISKVKYKKTFTSVIDDFAKTFCTTYSRRWN